MKKISILIISVFCFLQTYANHISGGELFYEYTGPGALANTSRYMITMRLFRDCMSTGQTLDDEKVVIGIYKAGTLNLHTSVTLPLQRPIKSIQLNTGAIPCLTNAPAVCFQIGIFVRSVDLPNTADGFILSWVRCCRADGISNLRDAAGAGGTFTTTIPGTDILPSGNNSSPQFAVKDTALVCQNKNFVLDFGASDKDGDSLSYSFCSAYFGGTSSNPNPGSLPAGPDQVLQLTPLAYQNPYNGNIPLGEGVVLNPATGKITGKAPPAGRYVINVCVTEWRNGVVLNEHRKDFILAVGNCDYAAAEPTPLTGSWCKNFTVNFSNNNTSSTIQSYFWDFGVTTATNDTSTQPVPEFTYADTGVYLIKLVVRGSAGCVDSGTSTLGVYPGFKPDFSITGSCYKTPFAFEDKTDNTYGTIQSYKWDFGDVTATSDTSVSPNPTYKYPAPADNLVSLTVTSTKGCVDSISKTVAVRDIPLIVLPFRDTLICSIDSLRLHATGTGVFTWTPAYNLINADSPEPIVYPKDTTTYFIELVQDGCTGRDSITVAVIDSVTVYAGADTTICKTDTINLQPLSNAISFLWSPPYGLESEPNIKNPVARPDTTTIYTVVASVGKCQAKDLITIKVVPYPRSNAGGDVVICYGQRTQLSGVITGSSYTWTPPDLLENPASLSPIAGPMRTTSFVLGVFDTIGCPKPSFDTVVVGVIPPVKAFAGNDTTIVAGQPLKLQATGGSIYAWSPAVGMDSPFVASPTVTLGVFYDSIIYRVKVSVAAGCSADDEVKVKVFKTGPDIFIPTAFTPNHDGRNDILKPIPVGVVSINYFRIYNRWGQLLYTTKQIGDGWDGTWKGKEQASGTYVFMAEGTDYLQKSISKKGTVVLIR